MNLFQIQSNTIGQIISAYLVVGLSLTLIAPLSVSAEDTGTPPSTETVTPPPPEPEPEPAPQPDTSSDTSSETTDTASESSEASEESSQSSESSVSESTEASEDRNAEQSESSSESSEQTAETESSSESTHTESQSETEVTVAASEQVSATSTQYAPTSDKTEEHTERESTNTKTANASTTPDTTTPSTNTIGTTATGTTSSTPAIPNNPSASTTLATTTDTTSSTTPQVGVSSVADGDATVGTTTTVSNPGTTTSTSTASSSIATGDAVATANILNMVNTNLVNSNGAVVFYNSNGGGGGGTVDIRKQIDDPASSTCSLLGCAANTTNVQLDSNATIDNAVVLSADTGNNLVKDADTGKITTGNAYANANIINIANLNLIDSQYLLLTLNAFGNFNSDLVLPALAPLLNNAKTTPALSLDNAAIILNEVTTAAKTGENTTNASAGAITTGDATTGASLYNNINTNLVNDNVRVLFNVHGDWNGVVFGLPDGVSWQKTDQGYLLDIKGAGSTDIQPGATTITATNTAVINNRISVAANTGGNDVSDANTALISTGNAFAGANIVNVANANIVGQNWMLAIVNVFGDFNGNVSFGRPDIWVGGAATVPSRIKKDSLVSYTYTIRNNGDAPASNIVVTDDVSDHIEPTTVASGGAVAEDGSITWQITDLEPGESTTVTYEGRVTVASHDTEITNTINSTLVEPDDNYTNNTEVVTFYTSGKSRARSSDFTHFGEVDDDEKEDDIEPTPTDGSPITALSLTRTPLVSTVTSEQPDAVQTIKIVNDTSRPVYNALFLDQLYDLKNQLVHEERVDLGTVLPYEEITFSYTLSFNHPATPPLQTYSFDSVFYDGTEEHILGRNGYINHLSDRPVVDEIDVEFSLPGTLEITSTSSQVARVFGTSTGATGTISHWPEPLVPLINASVDNTSGGGTGFAVSPTDLVFPSLLLVLLLTYGYLRYRPQLPSLQRIRNTDFKFPLW